MTTRAQQAVAEAEATLAAARRSLDDERRRRTISCSCGKRHAIGKLALVRHQWYTPPRSCTEGDYWSEGEWGFLCPDDGHLERLMFEEGHLDWKERDTYKAAEPNFKAIYGRLFASAVDEYDGHVSGCRSNYDPCECSARTGLGKPHRNNYDVDRHRARFELPLKPDK